MIIEPSPTVEAPRFIHELVRHPGRHHHDLPAARLDRLLTGREDRVALLNHEDLFVWMTVQLRAASRRRGHHDKRDTSLVVVSLELACVLAAGRVGQVDNARPARGFARSSLRGCRLRRPPFVVSGEPETVYLCSQFSVSSLGTRRK
jgi:hypothetical protein